MLYDNFTTDCLSVIAGEAEAFCRDTEVLCDSLTYDQSFPDILSGTEVQEFTTVYSPPFDEFEVYRVVLPPEASTLIPANQVAAVLFLLQVLACCCKAVRRPLLVPCKDRVFCEECLPVDGILRHQRWEAAGEG